MSAINRNTNGSIIIAALIITMITGSLVGLYLKTVTQEVQNAYRSRMSFQAVNLAEAGLEHAMYALIKDDWTGWTQGSKGYYRDTFPNVSYNWRNERRSAIVYIEPDRVDGSGDPLPPLAIAEGTITLRTGVSVSRQIYVELTHGTSDDVTRGGFWGNGILGKKSITFGGNKQTVDSFHTGNPGKSTGQPVASYYSGLTSTTILGDSFVNDNGSAASLSVTIDDIILGNADIYGNLGTGAAETTDISSILGPNGTIYDADSGKAVNRAKWRNNVDYGNLSFEVTATLPDVEPATFDETLTPTTVDVSLTNNGSLSISDSDPSDGTAELVDITNFSVNQGGALTIGQPTGGNFEITSVSADIGGDVIIQGNVVMVIDGDLNIKGLLDIQPYTDSNGNTVESTLELYISGDVDVGGTGIANQGLPENLIIYQTQTEADAELNGASTFNLHGTAPMSAAVYAPNSDISLRGGGGSGAFYGAVVGNSVLFSGNNYDFHYDEALGELGGDDLDPDDDAFIPEVNTWVELTDASVKKNMGTILTDGL